MREIKFRAWDDRRSCWTIFDLFNVEQDESYRVSALGTYLENTVIEQYTGLKDITGRELYEGDRIAFETVETVRRHNGDILTGTIYWQPKAARFGIRVDGRHIPMSLGQINLTYVGNIHENPELLDDRA